MEYYRKKTVRLTEGQLVNLVKETISQILKEEVDLGQIDAMRDRPRGKEYPEELRKKIRQLRLQIGDLEANGEDTSHLTRQIRNLKREFEGE